MDDSIKTLLDEMDPPEGRSMHLARLHRALLSLDAITQGDGERATHCLTRLGIWANYLAEEIETGAVRPEELARDLRFLGRAGDLLLAADRQ